MGKDHCFNQADAFGDGRCHQVRSRRDDVSDEEESAELGFWEREFAGEEVGYPRGRNQA